MDCRFNTMIAVASDTAVLAELVSNLRRKTYMVNLHSVPERFEIGHREHLAVLSALRAEDRDAARAGIRDHIDNVRQSIIRKLSDI